MSVFRVKKNQNYTVMSNYHLKDKNISLKAKGLLSVILALPEDWNYSIRGLSAILMEGVTAVSNILKELETAGYIERNLVRGENGKIKDTEYIIYENPANEPCKEEETSAEKPCKHTPKTEKPQTDFLFMGEQYAAGTDADDGTQLNTNIINTKRLNTYQSISKDITTEESGLMDGTPVMETHEDIRSQLAENIDYTSLVIDEPDNRELVDECLAVMSDVLEEGEDKIRIGGKNIPYIRVKERFFRLTRMHMQYVLESLENTTCSIRNIRAYLLTVLFNAATTINMYYRQRVNHDMYTAAMQNNMTVDDRMDAVLAGFRPKSAGV